MARTPASPERGPAVLIVGGLLTSPWVYWSMKRPLMARGASRVSIAPLFGVHWLVSAFVGLGPATSIVTRAIERLSDEDGGRPILVIGHSGGGILARLATARRSFDGARRAPSGAVGAIVTLGTPHLAQRVDGTLGRQGMRALRFLARFGSSAGGPSRGPSAGLSGDPEGPAVLSVGSSYAEHDGGSPWSLPSLRTALARACYAALLGPAGRRGPGDGMVPVACAHLPGARTITLGGFAHGPFVWGARWYGAEAGIEAWWAQAARLWTAAVAGGSPTIGP
jgi:hypothetical protein